MADTAQESDAPLTVEEWRRQELAEAGYPQEEAYLLAGRLDVDLHGACDLLALGCPVALAIRILT